MRAQALRIHFLRMVRDLTLSPGRRLVESEADFQVSTILIGVSFAFTNLNAILVKLFRTREKATAERRRREYNAVHAFFLVSLELVIRYEKEIEM